MMRLVAILIFCAFSVFAQEPEWRIDIAETEAIPGQPVSMRLTVLVPGFMPEPPVWPAFEAPNLIVRMVSSGPVSERIGGATWAGISRRYLLYPMLPGPVSLPPQDIVVTWVDPATGDTAQLGLPAPTVTITGVVPDAAEGLDPFLAAEALTLDQTIDGVPEGMTPGDSFTRTVTATIEGTLPMFLPPLLSQQQIEGVRAYPDAAVFEDLTSGDEARGTRSERVTFVAEGGGAGEAGGIRVQWYNLSTGEIETEELPPVAVLVNGPPARTSRDAIADWRTAILTGLAVLGALGLVLISARRLAPPLGAWVGRQHAAWMASEGRAWSTLRRTIAARDYVAVHAALDAWALRIPGRDPCRDPDVSDALASLGRARYSRAGTGDTAAWRTLERSLAARRRRASGKAGAAALPPLNPGT